MRRRSALNRVAESVVSCAYMQLPRLTLLHIGVGTILLGLTGGIIVMAMLLGDVDGMADASAPAGDGPRSSTSASPQQPGGGATASVDERIAFWESRVAANATDYSSSIALIDAYLDRVRASGDLSDLDRAQTALDQARTIAPLGDVRLLLRGLIAAALDREAEARELLTRAAAHESALPPLQVPALHAAIAALGD